MLSVVLKGLEDFHIFKVLDLRLEYPKVVDDQVVEKIPSLLQKKPKEMTLKSEKVLLCPATASGSSPGGSATR